MNFWWIIVESKVGELYQLENKAKIDFDRVKKTFDLIRYVKEV